MTTSFDFKIPADDYVYNITLNQVLHITRASHSVAVLHFKDYVGNKIDVPQGIVVYTRDPENPNRKVVQEAIKQSYALCWTEDYTVEMERVTVLQIKSQRKWNIQVIAQQIQL